MSRSTSPMYDPMMDAEYYHQCRETLRSEGYDGCGNHWYRSGRRWTLHGALQDVYFRRQVRQSRAAAEQFTEHMRRIGERLKRNGKFRRLSLANPATYRNLPHVRYRRLSERKMLMSGGADA